MCVVFFFLAPLGGFWVEWQNQTLREAEFLEENDQTWYLPGRGPMLTSHSGYILRIQINADSTLHCKKIHQNLREND